MREEGSARYGETPERVAKDVVRTAFISATLFFVAFVAGHAYAAQVSTNLYIAVCGDGIVQPSEVCDDGAKNGDTSYATSIATRHCQIGCQSFGPYCGDRILQVRFGEQCDDGNNVTGDLCSPTCQIEAPSPPISPPTTGSPAAGSIPSQSGTQGTIVSETQTQVILRGKAYPNSTVNILLDGTTLGAVQANSNADFVFSTAKVTPGIATFSFSSTDNVGTASIMDSVVFFVVQSAITTVANVFLPPTINLDSTQIASGGLLNISGQTSPFATITTQIDDQTQNALVSTADGSGDWALQLNTGSISDGDHAVKAFFELSTSTQSGFGRSVSFSVGNAPRPGKNSPDLNGDGKVNLIDFSIFLTLWGTGPSRGDFNGDGATNLADFSIMLFNWTG